jgi:predicted ATPase/tRNA A-37 threonylcarbamoyl transferase component Bud32
MREGVEAFGKYELGKRIGAGGMAEVFLARGAVAQGLAKQLVIKKIHPAFARSRHFVRMFIDEAKIALGLNHPCIVQVFDFGHVGQTFFLAMEHVEGVDLLRLMQEGAKLGRRVPYGLSAYIVQQVCRGLDYAHRKTDEYGEDLGIVHRDISPQNVLISWDGSVKLTDFGIARARDVQEEEGVVKGKFAYMSPEQARGNPVDRRSDIYSAGIVLFELACARPLYSGRGAGNGKEILEAVRAGAIPRPRDCDPNLPAALEDIILRALAYHADDRFQTARDLQHALGRFQIAHAQARGEMYDSGGLAQFMAQIVPRERRVRAPTEPVAPVAGAVKPAAPDPAATPVARRGSLIGTPVPSAPAAALTPGLAVPIAPETRERKHVLIVEGQLRGLAKIGTARGQKAVADFLRMAGDIAWKHDAHPHRPATSAGFTYVVGLPVAGEDDPARAVRLALALVDALDGVGQDVEPELRLAVGIERASALVTRKGGASFTYELTGTAGSADTPSFARRLASEAPGGEVLVGGEVFRVARAEWSFEELAPIDLAGPDEAEPRRAKVYQLRGPKEREQRMRERAGDTVLYGRELELKALRDAYRDVCTNRRKHHVVILGEEGVGKRSLVTAFLKTLPTGEAMVLRAACRAATVDTPFSIVADLARDLLGLAEGAEPREVLRRVTATATMLYPDASDARSVAVLVSTVAKLLGVSDADEGNDPDERRARILSVLRRIEDKLANDQPLIVIVEDIHWADSQSWDVFWEIIRSPSARPVLGIATARPDERIIEGATETPHSLVVAVEELEPEDRVRLIRDRFADGEDEAALATLATEITAKAGGNPFYIREVLDALVERGILAEARGQPGKLTWIKRDAPILVPSSALALVGTRLDRLPPGEKEVLGRAAVFGRVFSAAEVAALIGRPVDEELASLARLVLVEARGAAWAFRNEVTQQSAYETLPEDARAALHRRAADVLSAAPGYRAGQDDALIARHLERAGDLPAAAARYLAAAGHARDVRGNVEAFRHLSRAIAILPREAHLPRFTARAEREAILRAWGQRARQLRELHLMRREAEALGDAAKLADTLTRLGQLYADAGKLAAARAVLGPAVDAARRAAAPLLEAEAVRVEAVCARLAGDNVLALDLCGQALALCGDDRAALLERAQILNNKGTILWYLSRLREAIEAHAEALVIYRNLRVPRQEARALNNIGIVFSALGEFEEALGSYKRALKIDQELGDRAQIALKLANIGQVYVDCGDTDRAEQYLKKALAIAEQLRDQATAADASITLGQAYLKRGEILRARKVLERGLALATQLSERYQEIRGRLYLALARLECGEAPERSAAEARQAAELARAAPMPIGEIYGHAIEALALARMGRLVEAEAQAQAAVRLMDSARAHEGADEILFIHARLARGSGRHEAAAASLARALDEVHARARRMKDPDLRRIYLAAPPARDILASAGERAGTLL